MKPPAQHNPGAAELTVSADELLTAAPAPSGRLFVVAVGISAYNDPRFRLVYAAKDAQDVAAELKKQEGRLFREVIARVLTDQQATREAIINAIDDVDRECSAADTALIYLAGHGVNDERRARYHFFSVNAQEDRLPATALTGMDLREWMSRIKGQRVLMLDTCFAGNVLQDQPSPSIELFAGRGLGDAEENRPELLLRELRAARRKGGPEAPLAPSVADRPEVTILAAAGPRQPAAESNRWGNGVFTMAFLQGLRGRALSAGKTITIADLASYTRSRVMYETGNRQHPIISLSASAERPLAQEPFELAYPLGTQVGSYLITQRLGDDPEGVNYQATREDAPGVSYVLRALHPELSDREDSAARFQRAAELLQRVKHPGLVSILEVGRLRDGRCHLLAQPQPWPTRAAQQGQPLKPAVAYRALRELASALSSLHEQGVLYLGLCPQRVALAADGAAQLLDCSEAQSAKDPVYAVAQQGDPQAQPAALYAAPERSADAPAASDRSDVYSLGALAHEFLTGRPPFQVARLEDLTQARARPAPTLPGARGALVAAMLSLNPAARPSAAAVALRLRELEGLRLPPLRYALPLGALLALVAGGGGWLALRHRPAPPTGKDASVVHSGNSVRPERTLSPPKGESKDAAVAVVAKGESLPKEKTKLPPTLPEPHIAGAKDPVVSSANPVRPERSEAESKGALIAADLLIPAGLLTQAGAGPGGADRTVPVRAFYLDRTEVDNEHFAAWLRGRPGVERKGMLLTDKSGAALVDLSPPYSGLQQDAQGPAPRPGFARRPVVQVSHAAAQEYCAAQQPKRRLVRDMEWELAAAGSGPGRAFPWGDAAPTCAGVIFGRRPSLPCAGQTEGPAEVGSAPQDRTPDGVMDLGGNVAEWVDSRGLPATAPLRPVRGGSWARAVNIWRARVGLPAARVSTTVGFRCARDTTTEKEKKTP